MKYTYEIPVFDGGLNTKNNPSSLPPNQSPDLLNVIFDDYGAVATRLGQAILNTAAIGSAAVDGLKSYKKDSLTSYLVAACNASIHYASGTTFVSIPSAQSIFTAGVNVNFMTVKDMLLVTNGYQKPYKWDGTYFTQFGVSAPVVAATAVTTNSGNLNGTYYYVITGVNSNLAESDYGPVSSAFTAVSNQLTVGNLPVWPTSAGVNYNYLYRTTALASGVYYKVTAITNGVTSIVDNVADSSLVTQPPTDNGVMPKCKFTTQYQGRIFAAGDPSYPMRIYFSEADLPETWPDVNYLDINAGDGYPITGLELFSNSIVIHKNDDSGNGSIYMLYIPDSTGTTGTDNWYLTKSPSAYGGQSGKALVFFNNFMAFINAKGMFALSGQDVALNVAEANIGKFLTDSRSFDIEPDVLSFKQSLIKNIAGVEYKNKLWFSVPSSNSSTYNDKIYQYDFVRLSNNDRSVGAWTKFNAHNINCFAEHAGNLYGGSSIANGYVYQLDTTYNDNGAAISSYFVTATISGDKKHRDYTKVWRFLIVWYECSGAWNLKVEYTLNAGLSYSDPIYLNLTPGGSVWGTAIYNTDSFGGGLQRNKQTLNLKGPQSRDIQFKFSTNTISNYWKIHKIQVQYNLRGLR